MFLVKPQQPAEPTGQSVIGPLNAETGRVVAWATRLVAVGTWLAAAAITQFLPDIDDFERTELLVGIMAAIGVVFAVLALGSRALGVMPSERVRGIGPWCPYPWRTVRNNAALGLEARGLKRSHSPRVDQALCLVGLTNFADAYPHQLWGGMAQRAALARALMNDPELLLMDEPLGKLDSMTRITMQGELVSLWERSGFTALPVTHDVEEALFMAQRVIVLSDRPARVKADVAVELPYPRHRGDRRIAELRREVLGLLDAAW